MTEPGDTERAEWPEAMRAYIEELEAEVQRLRALVHGAEDAIDRLPRTADGIVVLPGDQVYHPWAESPEPWYVGGGTDYPIATIAGNDEEGGDVAECYSTPEKAADAAKTD